jgi:periplasmic divalent cation tolerance protein
MKYIAIFTTVDSLPHAQFMARSLVERKLAACAQISENQSFYTWNDTLHDEKEFRILFKSTSDTYPAAEAAILELHTYALPAIHAVALERVYPPYAAWMERKVTIP